jgi:hypothetical protein
MFFGLLLASVGLMGALSPAQAHALPGQCWSSPFGGFCDTNPLSDGSFQHCLTYGSSSYCTQACHDPITNMARPTDMDPNTPC